MPHTTYSAEQIVAIGGKRWNKAGYDRVYLDNWPDMVGLSIHRYNTGNVSSATLNGTKIANRRASILGNAKVYWENGRVRTTQLHQAQVSAGVTDDLVEVLCDKIAELVAALPDEPAR